MQDGSSHNLFIREKDSAPVLGEGINLSSSEKTDFQFMLKILRGIVNIYF